MTRYIIKHGTVRPDPKKPETVPAFHVKDGDEIVSTHLTEEEAEAKREGLRAEARAKYGRKRRKPEPSAFSKLISECPAAGGKK